MTIKSLLNSDTAADIPPRNRNSGIRLFLEFARETDPHRLEHTDT